MDATTLYPLLFEPIFQYRIWGGRRFEKFLDRSLPGDQPIGEAWVLSDRDDFASKVAEGPLKGQTITELIANDAQGVMGRIAGKYPRFPLLLKFLDAKDILSVQVHPTDAQKDLLPKGENGKTEAWVVLEADPTSKIYEGLNPGTTPETVRQAIHDKTLGEVLPHFTPKAGDGVFIPAGTVHALGDGVMVFEVQQNSDVTFRLYDWDRIDKETGKPRDLHVDKGLAAINFSQRVGKPVQPVVEEDHREAMFENQYFWLWRLKDSHPFTVGAAGEPRVLVCIEGSAQIEHGGVNYHLRRGGVILLPAVVGECQCVPDGAVNVLEIKVPG
jgi:mannose-6-phosphate isomerase